MHRKKIAIIGSGIAGMATSIRLAKKGYDVHIFEANSYPGGKITEFEMHGYRFDTGPSLFTMPQLVDELFALCGENPRDHFRYLPLPVACHYFYDDGTFICGYSNKGQLATELEEKTTEKRKNVLMALEKSAFLYNHLADLFIFRPLNDLKTFINKKALKAYIVLGKLNLSRSMNDENMRLFHDPKVVQLFNRYATYNGSNPYQAPATLNIIPHLEYNIGAFFPEKGMYDITNCLFELAKRNGAQFHFNKQVVAITLDRNRATGISLANGEHIAASRVVCNMDMVSAYKKLLPGRFSPTKLLNQPKSSSALIFYWGINKTFAQLDLHNIFFSSDYKAEFDHIFNLGGIYHDPTVYINITSKYKYNDAPMGKENWFTMINVPNNQGQNWAKMIRKAKSDILAKLKNILKEDIAQYIECEKILDPRSIELRTSSWQGALYGNSSNSKMAAFLRHPNKSNKIKGLYFCGGSVHPGGGIPLCLSSAKIVSGLIPNPKN